MTPEIEALRKPTGLFDFNKKEAFEYDIIFDSQNYYIVLFDRGIKDFIVCCNNRIFNFKALDNLLEFSYIVGNIFDNAELVQKTL